MLNGDELIALRALIAQQGSEPQEIVRHQGVVCVRYYVQFWRIAGSHVEEMRGMFPNPATHAGVERVQVTGLIVT